MKPNTSSRTLRVAILAALAILALALWTSQSSAQPAEPFQVYGTAEPGDIIAIHDADGNAKGAATTDDNGDWFVQIQCSADTLHLLSFTINGHPADADFTVHGSTLAEVTLTLSDDSAMPDDADHMADDDMTDDGELMEEDAMSDDKMSDDEMSDDEMSDDTMEDDMMDDGDDKMLESTYPGSGTGGLADDSPSTGALIGTLALLATLLATLGIYRFRTNRA
ncbi:MAG: hypothetical protein OXS30_05170 [Chloroflexota bacterium]|nr:hypothetical protein [Chloroflexota bacterium]